MTNAVSLTTPYPAAVLLAHGLQMPAPEQVYVDQTVPLARISPKAMLFPGTRVVGENTLIQANARIGSEGPATISNCAFGPDTTIASGFAAGAVLLAGASLGGSAHVRPTTLLEEGVSTAHCVGLKQTVLMSFVTFGSLINACDLLIAGGTSKEDHTEVGSGFIHFNFTPWGKKGDKATASLIGNVTDGVFLRQRRIFLGGLSGLVGPAEVESGAITVAGQVIRRKIERNRLSGVVPRMVDVDISTFSEPRINIRKLELNCLYIGELCALRAWYRHIRLPRADVTAGLLIQSAEQAITAMLHERFERLGAYTGVPVQNRQQAAAATLQHEAPPAPADLLEHQPELAHLDWVHSLPLPLVESGGRWLRDIASTGRQCAENMLRGKAIG